MTGRSVTRRSLLVGGAGVIIGAGVTEATNALTGTSDASAGPHLASPGEELMIEHGVLKRVLLCYRAAADQLATQLTTTSAATRPATTATLTTLSGAITDAAQVISDYVEGFHEGLEEAYVFPRVRSAEPDLITTLLVQHDRGRHITAGLLITLADGLNHDRAQAQVERYLRQFVRMYEPHEAWEDTVVYPALRARTSQRTLDDLAARFVDLADQHYGDDALAQTLQRVAGIEAQLGIGDLATFTP